MQDKVESTVKKAIKELKKSKDIDVDLNQSGMSQRQESKGVITHGATTILSEIDSPNRISPQVQITR